MEYTAVLFRYYHETINKVCEDGSVSLNAVGEIVAHPYPKEKKLLANILKVTMTFVQASLYKEIGSYNQMLHSFQSSLDPERFSVIRTRRQQWIEQRAALRKKIINGRYTGKVRFVTYASQPSAGLDTLILSANLSLINLEVLYASCSFTIINDLWHDR